MAEDSIATIVSKRMADQIAEEIIEQIRQGDLEEGAILPTERELCEQFETSRPTVREALKQMRLQGFLSASSGQRPRVTKPSLEGILQMTGEHIRGLLGDAESGAHLEQMRQFIEIGAVRHAVKMASNLQVTAIAKALEKNFKSIGTKDFAATDIAFHRCIVCVLDNPIILQLHDMFVSGLFERRIPEEDPFEQNHRSYEEHRLICQYIIDGDVIAATDMMDQHLTRSYRERLKSAQSITVGAKATRQS
ncbi:GntR family transcriptional regulator [uncultured Cohaesibacter sp.]|uniref:GntR family transcriptional regulator n=1 Tax=uncultured Cohaesibacter sp. TaxID=1002546 RepID=UPI0029C802AE|nr:GntR family transcriptional regulator [uncultured Cohaesibacter sp.]